jgi:hypothetical protein
VTAGSHFKFFYPEEQQSDGERGWMIEVDDEEGVRFCRNGGR